MYKPNNVSGVFLLNAKNPFNVLLSLTIDTQDMSDSASVCSIESSRSVDSQLSSVADSPLPPPTPDHDSTPKDRNVRSVYIQLPK